MDRRHHCRRDKAVATVGLTCVLSEMGKISRCGHSYKEETVTIHTTVCIHVNITSLCNMSAVTSAVNCFRGTNRSGSYLFFFFGQGEGKDDPGCIKHAIKACE
jgi:hypothetical protein